MRKEARNIKLQLKATRGGEVLEIRSKEHESASKAMKMGE